MGFLRKLFGVVNREAAFQERIEEFEKSGRLRLIKTLVLYRITQVRRNSLPFSALFDATQAQAVVEAARRYLLTLTNAELMGTPEATFVVVIEEFLKLRMGSEESVPDWELCRTIEIARALFPGPSSVGAAVPGVDLETFSIRLVKAEFPESAESLGDPLMRNLFEMALDGVLETYGIQH